MIKPKYFFSSDSEPFVYGCLQNDVFSSFQLSGHTCGKYAPLGTVFLESMNIHRRNQKEYDAVWGET